MARAGRNRKKDLTKRKQPTTRAGRQRHDAGTMEALLHRAAVLQATLRWDGKVPRFYRHDNTEIAAHYAEYPLGVLYARQLITIRQHDVGIAIDKFRNFSGMRAPGFSLTGTREFVDRTMVELLHLYDEDAAAKATARYREGCGVMTPAQRREVLNVCCYGEMPVWLNNPHNTKELTHLQEGLDALYQCYVKGQGPVKTSP